MDVDHLPIGPKWRQTPSALLPHAVEAALAVQHFLREGAILVRRPAPPRRRVHVQYAAGGQSYTCICSEEGPPQIRRRGLWPRHWLSLATSLALLHAYVPMLLCTAMLMDTLCVAHRYIGSVGICRGCIVPRKEPSVRLSARGVSRRAAVHNLSLIHI